MSITKLAVFMLDDECFGLDISNISTVEKDITVQKAKGYPDNINGIIHLRGDIIPVYSLRRKFSMNDKAYDKDIRLIIGNLDGVKIAFEVDNMMGINEFESEQLLDVPSIVKSGDTIYLKNVAVLDNRLLLVLDNDKIVSDEELNRIRQRITDKKQGV